MPRYSGVSNTGHIVETVEAADSMDAVENVRAQYPEETCSFSAFQPDQVKPAAAPPAAPVTDDDWHLAGLRLVELLNLRPLKDKPGRIATSAGDKTPQGLARTVYRVITEEGFPT